MDWSLVPALAHNQNDVGSNPTPANILMLDFSDIAKITTDYLYRDPDHILAALACAAEHDDKEMLHYVLTECRNRGIDVVKLLKDDLDRHERIWGKIR